MSNVVYTAKSAKTTQTAFIERTTSQDKPWRVRTKDAKSGLTGPDAVCSTFAEAKRKADRFAAKGKFN